MTATLPKKRPAPGYSNLTFAVMNSKGSRLHIEATVTEEHAKQIVTAINTPTLAESGIYGRDGLMAIGAFRYALGRMTYIATDTADWLIAVWPILQPGVKTIIQRELAEAIRSDDEQRASGSEYRSLGHDCDRAAWLRLRDAIAKEVTA